MPELPEVETVVRDLRPVAIGRTIRTVQSSSRNLRRSWQTSWNSQIIGQVISAIRRRGKWILLDLQGNTTILVHLGMTGQFTAISPTEPADEHVHLRFGLDSNLELRFRDIRRFGSVDVFTNSSELLAFLSDRLGPEPFGVDPTYFRNAVQSSKRNLKAILLDQTIVAGVGNIYADESCYLASLHPARLGSSLTNAEIETLRLSIETVLTRAIEGRGSTIRNYVGGSGLQGTFQHEFHVYGRTGQQCEQCQTSIEVQVLAGRSSHYCPQCQPLKQPRKRR